MADKFDEITKKYYKGSAFTKTKDKTSKSVVLGNNSEEEIQANHTGSVGQLNRLGAKRHIEYLKRKRGK